MSAAKAPRTGISANGRRPILILGSVLEMMASGPPDADAAVALIAAAATPAGLPRVEAERTAHSGIRTTDVVNLVDRALAPKPDLIVHASNPPATAEALRDLLAASGKLFDRGMPVRIIQPADGGPPSAARLTKHNVVFEAHRLCQPVRLDPKGDRQAITLSERLAQMYLDMTGEWDLPPLAGVSTAPLLSADGSVRVADGYDPETALWCCHVPILTLPPHPSRTVAEAALWRLREAFRTFPFSDASRR
jgi:hypothetical protein